MVTNMHKTFKLTRFQSQNFFPTYFPQKIQFKLLQRCHLLNLTCSIRDTPRQWREYFRKIKTQKNIQTIITSIRAQNHISKLQTQPREVSVSDIFLSMATCVNIDLYNLKFPTGLPSGIYPHSSRLQTQMRFVTSLICGL